MLQADSGKSALVAKARLYLQALSSRQPWDAASATLKLSAQRLLCWQRLRALPRGTRSPKRRSLRAVPIRMAYSLWAQPTGNCLL